MFIEVYPPQYLKKKYNKQTRLHRRLPICKC